MYDEQTSVRCHGTTTKGEQCKLQARPNGDRCARHAKSVATGSLDVLDEHRPTADISAPSDHVRRVFDSLPLSLRQRLDAASRVGAAPERSVDKAPRGETYRPSNGSRLRLALVALSLLTIWGVYAIDSNSSDSGTRLPVGSVGTSACQQTMDDVRSNVPNVIADAPPEVNSIVAENPALAPYAAAATSDLVAAAPQVHADIDQAGQQPGC